MTRLDPQRVIHDLHVDFPETRRTMTVQNAIDALAAVTAERDQARQMLADAERRISEMEVDESLREEDERFADPL